MLDLHADLAAARDLVACASLAATALRGGAPLATLLDGVEDRLQAAMDRLGAAPTSPAEALDVPPGRREGGSDAGAANNPRARR